jgi:glycosyltransferase involved in cell wall biosynthesis
MRPARILIFEPEATGHQMEVLRYLLDSISLNVPNAHVILLTTEEAAQHPNTRRLIDSFGLLNMKIAPDVTEGSPCFRMISEFYERQWRNAERFSRGLDEIGAENVDFILLPHLESIGLLHLGLRSGLFRGRPWATLAVGVRFHHRQSGIEGPSPWQNLIQRWFFWRVINQPDLVCFGSVNPYLSAAVNHPKVAWCPEPAAAPSLSDAGEARKAYGLRPETCVVLVFGFIDRRKCLDVLLEAVARLDPGLDLTVFLAGTQHPGHVAPILNGETARKLRERGRLVEANRYIMVGRDIDPMSVADISWVFYDKDFVFTGSVLVRSALSRRAVIGRRQGVIGRLVAESGCGLVLDSDAAEVVAGALTRLARDPALRREMGENGARAFARNTPEAFAQPLVDGINQALADRWSGPLCGGAGEQRRSETDI